MWKKLTVTKIHEEDEQKSAFYAGLRRQILFIKSLQFFLQYKMTRFQYKMTRLQCKMTQLQCKMTRLPKNPVFMQVLGIEPQYKINTNNW